MKTVMSVKVDRAVRDRAKKTAKKMGVPLSLVVNAGLRRFAEEERLVLETERAYRMSKKLERRLASVEADLKRGRNISPAFTNAKEAVEWLHAK
jgi:antitoxin component of RelBE/YafQ-DinJ toxin-antitoxin module